MKLDKKLDDLLCVLEEQYLLARIFLHGNADHRSFMPSLIPHAPPVPLAYIPIVSLPVELAKAGSYYNMIGLCLAVWPMTTIESVKNISQWCATLRTPYASIQLVPVDKRVHVDIFAFNTNLNIDKSVAFREFYAEFTDILASVDATTDTVATYTIDPPHEKLRRLGLELPVKRLFDP